jgi:hypothetical protein
MGWTRRRGMAGQFKAGLRRPSGNGDDVVGAVVVAERCDLIRPEPRRIADDVCKGVIRLGAQGSGCPRRGWKR